MKSRRNVIYYRQKNQAQQGRKDKDPMKTDQKQPGEATEAEPKPAGKVQQKVTARAREARIIREACERLGIIPAQDCRLFGCARQTLSSWMQGKTSAPREALVILLEKSNEAAQTRREVVKEELEAMRERITAGLEAAEKIRTVRNGG